MGTFHLDFNQEQLKGLHFKIKVFYILKVFFVVCTQILLHRHYQCNCFSLFQYATSKIVCDLW